MPVKVHFFYLSIVLSFPKTAVLKLSDAVIWGAAASRKILTILRKAQTYSKFELSYKQFTTAPLSKRAKNSRVFVSKCDCYSPRFSN